MVIEKILYLLLSVTKYAIIVTNEEFNMSAASIIHQQIEAFPNSKPFTIGKFKQYATGANLRQILSRLKKNGVIERITHDIYAKPEMYRGYKVVATGEALIECLEETTGEIVVTHGATAINQLGITTQSPMNEIYYYTGSNTTLHVNQQNIKLVHINRKYANKNNPVLELILSAAYYLGKENFTIHTLYTIEKKLTKEALLELHQYLSVMPAWVSHLFFEYYQGFKHE